MPDDKAAEAEAAEASNKPEAEPFDEDRARATITKQRESEKAALKRATDLEAKLKKFEDRDKSEAQRAAEEKTQAEERATSAERTAMKLEVALDKAPEGMSLAQLRKLAKRLTGSSREELEADADELFSEFAPAVEKNGDTRGRPKERLRSGAAPETEPVGGGMDSVIRRRAGR